MFLMPLICPAESVPAGFLGPLFRTSSVDHCHLLRQQVGDDSQRCPLLMLGTRATFLGGRGLIDEIELGFRDGEMPLDLYNGLPMQIHVSL